MGAQVQDTWKDARMWSWCSCHYASWGSKDSQTARKRDTGFTFYFIFLLFAFHFCIMLCSALFFPLNNCSADINWKLGVTSHSSLLSNLPSIQEIWSFWWFIYVFLLLNFHCRIPVMSIFGFFLTYW